MKSAYIAGPMTGYEHYNVAAFESAVRAWVMCGYSVITPFMCNSIVWRRHHRRDFDPTTDRCDYGDPILGEMLLADLGALAVADFVVVLAGWEKSRGARLEVLMAQTLGKQVFAEDGSPVGVVVEAAIAQGQKR